MDLYLPEPRWEAPELLRPGVKPIAPVEIDWSNPITKGIANCYLMGENLSLTVDKEKPILVNSGASVWSIGFDTGRRAAIVGATNGPYVETNDPNFIADYLGYTYVVHLRHNIAVGGKVELFNRAFGSSSIYAEINDQAGNYRLNHQVFNAVGGGGGPEVYRAQRDDDKPFIVAIASDNYGRLTGAINGEVQEHGTGVSAPALYSQPSRLFGRFGDSLNGGLYSFTKWNRGLADSELAKITRDYYHFFIPK